MDATGGILGVLILLLSGGIVSTLLASRRKACAWLSFVWTAAAAIWLGAIAVQALLGGAPGAGDAAGVPGAPLFRIPALNTSLVFGVDPLSAIFLLVIALLAIVSALYSVGYITAPPLSTREPDPVLSLLLRLPRRDGRRGRLVGPLPLPGLLGGDDARLLLPGRLRDGQSDELEGRLQVLRHDAHRHRRA